MAKDAIPNGGYSSDKALIEHRLRKLEEAVWRLTIIVVLGFLFTTGINNIPEIRNALDFAGAANKAIAAGG
jgi:hypothetical protein